MLCCCGGGGWGAAVGAVLLSSACPIWLGRASQRASPCRMPHPTAENFNWCAVPMAGTDVFLFVSLALIAAGVLFGKLSAVWVLIAGALVRGL